MVSLRANSPIYAGYVVSLSLTTPERVELTDWNNYQSIAAVVGFAINDGLEGDIIQIQTDGIIENSTWTLTYNKPAYAFASGIITQDIPPKNALRVGLAVSSTKLLIRISEFIMVAP